jgi:predicted RNase H-like HicB family nuclease
VTARDLRTGLARGGETRAEALGQLTEVLRLKAGEGEPIDEPDKFLDEEMDIAVDELGKHNEAPAFFG